MWGAALGRSTLLASSDHAARDSRPSCRRRRPRGRRSPCGIAQARLGRRFPRTATDPPLLDAPTRSRGSPAHRLSLIRHGPGSGASRAGQTGTPAALQAGAFLWPKRPLC